MKTFLILTAILLSRTSAIALPASIDGRLCEKIVRQESKAPREIVNRLNVSRFFEAKSAGQIGQDQCAKMAANLSEYLRKRASLGLKGAFGEQEAWYFAKYLFLSGPVIIRYPKDTYLKNDKLVFKDGSVDIGKIFPDIHGVIVPATASSFEMRLVGQSGVSASVVYSGALADSDLQITNLNKGVEVYINSEPSEANVFINDRKFHHLTNTSSAENPGEVKVRISKNGYKDWEQSQTLSAGKVWTINAALVKE